MVSPLIRSPIVFPQKLKECFSADPTLTKQKLSKVLVDQTTRDQFKEWAVEHKIFCENSIVMREITHIVDGYNKTSHGPIQAMGGFVNWCVNTSTNFVYKRGFQGEAETHKFNYADPLKVKLFKNLLPEILLGYVESGIINKDELVDLLRTLMKDYDPNKKDQGELNFIKTVLRVGEPQLKEISFGEFVYILKLDSDTPSLKWLSCFDLFMPTLQKLSAEQRTNVLSWYLTRDNLNDNLPLLRDLPRKQLERCGILDIDSGKRSLLLHTLPGLLAKQMLKSTFFPKDAVIRPYKEILNFMYLTPLLEKFRSNELCEFFQMNYEDFSLLDQAPKSLIAKIDHMPIFHKLLPVKNSEALRRIVPLLHQLPSPQLALYISNMESRQFDEALTLAKADLLPKFMKDLLLKMDGKGISTPTYLNVLSNLDFSMLSPDEWPLFCSGIDYGKFGWDTVAFERVLPILNQLPEEQIVHFLNIYGLSSLEDQNNMQMVGPISERLSGDHLVRVLPKKKVDAFHAAQPFLKRLSNQQFARYLCLMEKEVLDAAIQGIIAMTSVQQIEAIANIKDFKTFVYVQRELPPMILDSIDQKMPIFLATDASGKFHFQDFQLFWAYLPQIRQLPTEQLKRLMLSPDQNGEPFLVGFHPGMRAEVLPLVKKCDIDLTQITDKDGISLDKIWFAKLSDSWLTSPKSAGGVFQNITREEFDSRVATLSNGGSVMELP